LSQRLAFQDGIQGVFKNDQIWNERSLNAFHKTHLPGSQQHLTPSDALKMSKCFHLPYCDYLGFPTKYRRKQYLEGMKTKLGEGRKFLYIFQVFYISLFSFMLPFVIFLSLYFLSERNGNQYTRMF
jgi:hypothetical protein